MAKYLKTSEDIEKMFDDIKEETSIPQWVEFRVLSNNKQKELVKVVKLNDLIGTLTEGLHFAIVINENIFEQLPEDLQKIALEECIAGVAISESDAVSLVKGDFVTYTGILEKYGHKLIISLKESVKSLFDAAEEKEKQAKDAQKMIKKSKSN